MNPKQTLRGFATINYWADDVQAAADWYSEVLGIEPYFSNPGPDGRIAYVEFRVGDYQHELGIVNRAFAPPNSATEPGGAVMHWHVDDIEKTYERLLSLGTKPHQPVTSHGDTGFVAASVIDPFGNVLGIMYNPHYLEILKQGTGA